MLPRFRALIAAPFFILASWACVIGPREVPAGDAANEAADVYCGQMFECPCDGGRLYTSENECRSNTRNTLDAVIEAGQQEGLFYDPTCLGAFLESVDETACAGSSGSPDGCRPACNLFYGERLLGELCGFVGANLHNCAKGLDCNGTCWSRCGTRVRQGQSCKLLPCADGLFCDDDFCFPLPVAGQPCPDNRCTEGSFCDAVDSSNPSFRECIPLRDLGEPCTGHPQCRSLHCPVGTCAPVPARGEACPAQICSAGLRCDDDICVTSDAAICFSGAPF